MSRGGCDADKGCGDERGGAVRGAWCWWFLVECDGYELQLSTEDHDRAGEGDSTGKTGDEAKQGS